MRITNDFLDMFLGFSGFGRHEFQFMFGDGRKEAVTVIEREAGRFPETHMDQNFLTAFQQVSTWVESGRVAFLTVRSTVHMQHGFDVEEIRCWSLTALGSIPYSRREAADKHGVRHSLSVWDIDQDREQRYCDAWDRELVLG